MDSRILDANAAWWGVPLETLMENAGRAVALECRGFRKIAVVCGRGNNGGDGLVAARILLKGGSDVTVYALQGPRSRLNQRNLGRLPKRRLRMIESAAGMDFGGCDLIVDALIGVGYRGEMSEPLTGIIDKINASDARKLSVDSPSGGAVEADAVLSFHEAKVPGAKVADIGIPDEAVYFCGPGDVNAAIPRRERSSHKGDYGRLIVLGGSKGYIGTPALVAQAALRAGLDLVTVCVPEYVADKMPYDPNLIVRPLRGKDRVTPKDVDDVLALESDAVVFGNGLGRGCVAAVRRFMQRLERPAVIDADAISQARSEWLNDRMILTPHEGEFKRIFGALKDRVVDTHRMAAKTGAAVVLKGALDVVSDGKTTRVNDTGNPYMTVGGTGDVLAGVIGGLLAQNRDRLQSACAGVFLSGLAGDLAAKEYGVSLVATDVIQKIPPAIRECGKYSGESR